MITMRPQTDRRRFLATAIGACGWVATAPLRANEALSKRFRFEQVHMGVPWGMVLYSADEDAANLAADAAFGRVAALDACLSDYREDSELTLLNQSAGSGRQVPVSNDLWRVVTAAQDLSARTDGAFDMTVGPIVRLWRRARRYQQLPKSELLAEARQVVGFRLMEIDADRHTVKLTRPGMRLDPGGIAMGYAADEALRVLRQRGINRAMIDASGDIVCGDAPPDRHGWIVGIAPSGGKQGKPTRYLSVANASVTTSGDAFQFVEVDGARYSHIVDPQTGLGLTTRCSVTIVAPDGITADSVATAVSVLGPEKGAEFIERAPHLAGHIVQIVDGMEQVTETSRLSHFHTKADR